MIVLDTNVISELFRPRPDSSVTGWLGSLSGDVAITAVTLAELLAGVRRMPDGRRKIELGQRIASAVEPFRGSGYILAFDDGCAPHYADVLARRGSQGMPISTADAQIAAICRAHDATCATRNIRDFANVGVDLVDPWTT